jgi:hypothetical protein
MPVSRVTSSQGDRNPHVAQPGVATSTRLPSGTPGMPGWPKRTTRSRSGV